MLRCNLIGTHQNLFPARKWSNCMILMQHLHMHAIHSVIISPHQTSRSLYIQYISSRSMALSSATGLRPVMRRTSRHKCA